MSPIIISIKNLKNQKLGLAMISASLLVISFISVLLFNHQREGQLELIRAQGVGLVRLLANMPMAELAPVDRRQGVLQIIRQTQNTPGFGYVVVVDPGGNPLSQSVAAGVLVPADPLPREPSAWLGERTLTGQAGRTILEFYGPVIEQGELVASLRIGYLQPGFGPTPDQLPFIATLALAVFLLTPLFYFLVKREIKPLTEVNRKMQGMLDSAHLHQLELHPSGELHDFMQRFTQFIEMTGARIHSLEAQQSDVTMSQKVLSYQKSRIESALQSLPDAVMVMDEAGTITYGNNKLTNLLGVDLEQVVGSKPHDWCTNTSVLAYLASCHNNVARTFRAESIEFVPDCAPEKLVSVSAYPLFSPKETNQLLGTLFVFHDITDESVAKRARGEFVAHVSHELKTPLNVLHMYSEMLQDNGGANNELTIDAANVIHDEVERMSTLISNLLSMTKIEMGTLALDRKRVKLQDLVKDVFENITRSARGMELQIELQVPPELSAVSLDKDLFRIALNNLLTNAIKYNKPGGQVVLSAEENDEEILLRVRDTGIGISEPDQARIFDKFYRSESNEVRERTGHGLGLSLAREIVQLHHGELEVNSEHGRGSEFTVRFKKELGVLKQAI